MAPGCHLSRLGPRPQGERSEAFTVKGGGQSMINLPAMVFGQGSCLFSAPVPRPRCSARDPILLQARKAVSWPQIGFRPDLQGLRVRGLEPDSKSGQTLVGRQSTDQPGTDRAPARQYSQESQAGDWWPAAPERSWSVHGRT